MQTAAEIKEFSLKVIDIAPDDPRDAVVALALTFAYVVWRVNLSDERAMEAVRRALKQMRERAGGAEFDPFPAPH